MGKGDALLGAVIGLGLGEGKNLLDDAFSDGLPHSGRGIRGSGGGYTNPITGVGAANDAVGQALAAASVPNPASSPSAANLNTQILPPVDQGGSPLTDMPEANNGDLGYQLTPNTGADMHPEKFDTATGDALQTQRRARVFRAVSDAARINEILGQRQISRQQAAGLIRDYHQKYPDINLPIQPFTSEQARELRGRGLLAQKQDEAEALGLGREAYTSDPTTGLPVQNPVYFHKLALDQQAKSNQRLIDAEKERVRLSEAAQTQRELNSQAHERRLNADAALASTLKTLPKQPAKIDMLASTPEQVAKYEAAKAEYDNPITGHDAMLKAAREQWAIDKGYVPAVKPQAPAPVWENPHAAMPVQPAVAAPQSAAAPPVDPQALARQQGVPYFATPEEAKQKANGKPFINSEGRLMTPKPPVAPPQAAIPQHEQDAAAVSAGTVPLETALTWHTPEDQEKIKTSVQTAKQAKVVNDYIDSQANRVINGGLTIKDAMDELDSGSQLVLSKKLADYSDIDQVARNQNYTDFADAVSKTADVKGMKSRMETQLAAREAALKSEKDITPEVKSGDDPRAIIAKLKAAESTETQVASRKRTRKTK